MTQGGILHKDLSYKIQGVLMKVRNQYGPGLKEIIYCNAIEEFFILENIKFLREKSIKVNSKLSGKILGYYRPDFIIDDKIILEIKAVDLIPKNFIDQIYSYLKASNYELGIFVNFRSPKLHIKRILLTNDKKFNYKQEQ
jgi:GxxExxY protein